MFDRRCLDVARIAQLSQLSLAGLSQKSYQVHFPPLDLGCRLFQGPLEFLVLFLGQDLEELPVLWRSESFHGH